MSLIDNVKSLFSNSKVVKNIRVNRYNTTNITASKKDNLSISSVKNTISQYAKYVVEVPKFDTHFQFYQNFPQVQTPISRIAKRVTGLKGNFTNSEGYCDELLSNKLQYEIQLDRLIEEFVTHMLIFGQATAVMFDNEGEGEKSIQFVSPTEVTFWQAKGYSIDRFTWHCENQIKTIDKDFEIYKLPSVNSKYFGKSPLNSLYDDLNALHLDIQNFNEFLENNSFMGLAIIPKDGMTPEAFTVLKETVKQLNKKGSRYQAAVYDGVDKIEQIKQDLQFKLTDTEKDTISSLACNAVGYPYTFLKRSAGLGQGEQTSTLINFRDETIKPMQTLVANFINNFVSKYFEFNGLSFMPNEMAVNSFTEIAEIGLQGFNSGALSAYEFKTKYLLYKDKETQEDDKFRKFPDKTMIVKEGELKKGELTDDTIKEEQTTDDIDNGTDLNDIVTENNDKIELSANDKKKALVLINDNEKMIENFKSLPGKTKLQIIYGVKQGIVANQELDINQKRAVNSDLEYVVSNEPLGILKETKARLGGLVLENAKVSNVIPSQSELDYQDIITEEEKMLEREYLLFLLPALLVIEDNTKKNLLEFYNKINSDGVISFEDNKRMLALVETELSNMELKAVEQFTGATMDQLNNKSEAKAVDALSVLDLGLGAVTSQLNRYSFELGYKSNIQGFFSNSFRRVKENVRDNLTQSVKLTLAKEQANLVSFNKNDFKLSLLTHPRGLFRRTIEQASQDVGINHYKAIMPTYKINSLNPSGMTSQVLYKINTIQEWNKYNGVQATVNSVGGMGLHHNDFIFYYPIKDSKLPGETIIARKQRSEFLKII